MKNLWSIVMIFVSLDIFRWAPDSPWWGPVLRGVAVAALVVTLDKRYERSPKHPS